MFRNLINHRLPFIVGSMGLVLVTGGWWWAYAALGDIREPLILRFVGGGGITQTGTLSDINGMGLFGVFSVLVNSVLVFELDRRDNFLGKLVAAFTIVLSILLFIGFAAIISVN